jgi:hypothetical protein
MARSSAPSSSETKGLGLQKLVSKAFSTGRYTPPERTPAGRFTEGFGWFVFFAATAQFLAPDIIALVTPAAKAASPEALQELGMKQWQSVVVMVCGYFYALAGRAEAEWFFCASIIDRIIAHSIGVVLVLIGRLSLSMAVIITFFDLGSALITYYLYSKHIAQKEGKQQR